jgi:hypothetical protein
LRVTEPSRRLLQMPSEHLGEDWREVSTYIDRLIPESGLDLAEESVFLDFSGLPGSLREGIGECLIGRPVTGKIVSFEPPARLTDVRTASVHAFSLKSQSWAEIFDESFGFWETLVRSGANLKPRFTLKLSRRLNPDLQLSAEALFFE